MDNLSNRQGCKVALIGCGAVTEILYVGALNRLTKEGLLRTVAIVDTAAERLKAIGELLPVDGSYSNIEEMLGKVKPDLGIIASPHRFHEIQTVACLKAGVHVLCEKPMAVRADECETMLRAAEQSGKLLAIGHFRRFFPSCQFIKKVIDMKVLGPVISFQLLEGETYSWPAKSAAFFKRADAGGGVLIDAGVHLLDLLLWWLGDVTDLNYQDDSMGGIEANCRIYLKMKCGAQGTVQLSRDWLLPNKYRINFKKGWVTYICDVVDRVEWGVHDTSDGSGGEFKRVMDSHPGLSGSVENVPGFEDCFRAQLENVLKAIQGIESLCVSGNDAYKSVALIEWCYKNRTLLPMPWLTHREMIHAKELSHV